MLAPLTLQWSSQMERSVNKISESSICTAAAETVWPEHSLVTRPQRQPRCTQTEQWADHKISARLKGKLQDSYNNGWQPREEVKIRPVVGNQGKHEVRALATHSGIYLLQNGNYLQLHHDKLERGEKRSSLGWVNRAKSYSQDHEDHCSSEVIRAIKQANT